MKKYLLAASAIAMGLSMASGALADSDANDNDLNFLSAVGNSSNEGDDNNALLSGNNLDSNNSDDDENGNNRGNIVDSGNVDLDVDVGVEVDIDNSVNDSVIAEQDLDAETTNIRVTFDDAQSLITLLDGSQDFNTGEISQSDDAFASFTGIATIAMDTSLGSNNQAASQVAAGADIEFD